MGPATWHDALDTLHLERRQKSAVGTEGAGWVDPDRSPRGTERRADADHEQQQRRSDKRDRIARCRVEQSRGKQRRQDDGGSQARNRSAADHHPHLASDEADFITGHELVVDGGLTLRT